MIHSDAAPAGGAADNDAIAHRGPVLSYVIPKYVVLLKGWDRHTAALKAIMAGDAGGAEREIVADITEAAHHLAGLADTTGRLRRPSS